MSAPSSADRILAEAEARFAAAGYGGASLSSIARAAGLGNAGLLHHFGSKAALYRAVLEGVGTDIDERMDAAVVEVVEPDQRLRAVLAVLVDLGGDRPTALRIVMQEFLDDTDRIPRATVLPLAGAVSRTVAAVVEGQAAGVVVDGDPLALTARLHGTIFYGLLGTTVLGRVHEPPGEGWADRLVDAALAGLLAPTPPWSAGHAGAG